MSGSAREPENAGPRHVRDPAGGRADRSTGRENDAAHGLPGDDAPKGPTGEEETTGLKERIAELEDLWRRAVADAENLRKRFARDGERLRAEERARVAGEWLPVLDNLERALEHAAADPASIVEGVGAVRDQGLDVLTRLGYPRRDDVGAAFDPHRHEAVATSAGTGAPEGTVVHVVRPGYGDDTRQLRPAQVVVATGDATQGATGRHDERPARDRIGGATGDMTGGATGGATGGD